FSAGLYGSSENSCAAWSNAQLTDVPFAVAVGGITDWITSEAFNPSVLQPAPAATTAMSAALSVLVIGFLLLLAFVARARRGSDDGLRTVDDVRGDEDHQLGAIVADRLLLEEPA